MPTPDFPCLPSLGHEIEPADYFVSGESYEATNPTLLMRGKKKLFLPTSRHPLFATHSTCLFALSVEKLTIKLQDCVEFFRAKGL